MRLDPMSIVEAVSVEATESDRDIEGRPRKQIAGARVSVRAHEYNDQQNCRQTGHKGSYYE